MTDDDNLKEIRELEDSLAAALDSGDEANLNAALNKAQGIEDEGAQSSSNEDGENHAADDTATPGDDESAASGQQPEGGQGSQPDAGDEKAAAADDQAKAGEGNGDSKGGDAEEAPAPIAGKGGRGTIPYEVLKATREALGAAKAEIAKLSEKLQSRSAERDDDGAAAQQQGGTTDREKAAVSAMQEAMASGEELSDEDLEDLPPPLQKLYRNQQMLAQRLEKIGSVADEVVEDRRKSAAELTQDAIDTVPDLSAWQAKGGVLWAAAQDVDRQLVADPEWGQKPAVERFAEVARRVREDVGLPPVDEQQPRGGGKKADGEAASGRGGEKPRAAEPPGYQPPPSMSQMPGGGAPNLDKFESIERSSPAALAERMQGMTDDQINGLLAELS